MSSENASDKDKMGRFLPDGSPDIDRRLEESNVMIENTCEFLERLARSAKESRAYITEVKEAMERDRERLLRLQADQKSRGGSDGPL